MATVTQVLNAIVKIAADAKPANLGYKVRYFAGWPFPKEIGKDKTVLVSVFPYNVVKGKRIFLDVPWQEVPGSEKPDGTVEIMKEVSRKCRWIQVNIWADTPEKRDTIAESIDAALGEFFQVEFADTSSGTVKYIQEYEEDKNEIDSPAVYRRMLIYEVEHATFKHERGYKACKPTLTNWLGQEVNNTSDDSPLVLELE